MDMPNENIIDAYLHPEISDESVRGIEERHTAGAIIAEINGDIQEMTRTRAQRSLSSFNGAGDGVHNNNQLIWDENMPPFVIMRGRYSSKLWHYMPILILLSNSIFKFILNWFSIDANDHLLYGLTYTSHFTLLQWLTLFVMYLFKA